MKQITMIVGALLLFLLVSCEKDQEKNTGFDWDIQLSDVDKAGNTDDGATGDDGTSDDLIDGGADDLDEEPQPDGDQPVTEQKPDGDSDDATDIPVGDSDALITDNDMNDDLLITDTDEILTTNHRPVADAGPDLTALIGYEVTIDASKSYDFDQDELHYEWSILDQPAGSNIQIDLTDSQKPVFKPSLKGIYVFRLTVNDGKEYAQPDEISINVADYVPINFEIVDSAYSKSLDSIVFVSEEPENMLYIFDIEAKTIVNIPLPLIPISLSISPDGKEAVVGHAGWFSHVDLENKSFITAYNAMTIAFDIILDANRNVYVFPEVSWDLYVFDLDSGEATQFIPGFSSGTGSHAVNHPSGKRLFSIQVGANEIFEIDIEPFPIEIKNKITSLFPMGDDLWIAENGTKLFTKGGSIFFLNVFEDPSLPESMTYMGKLEQLETVKHLHNLGAVGRTVAIPNAPDDVQLNLYIDPYMSYEKTLKLPAITLNDSTYQYHGEVVYFNKDDTKIITVITTQIGTAKNYALAIIENF